MATEKQFRIICYLKTRRFWAIAERADEGFLNLNNFIFKVLDVCQMYCAQSRRPVKYSPAQIIQIRVSFKTDACLFQILVD